jgi:fructose-bisphosphate aldolase class II
VKLQTGKEMLERARAGGYGVGAFSAHNAETIQAILAAAEEEQAPVMIQIGQRVIRSIGMEPMVRMVESFGRKIEATVAIHLDHGNAFEQAIEAIQLRFQSVMYDGSHHPLDTNIAITRKVAEAAHAVGISVEGELGRIGGVEDDISVDEKDAMITDAAEAIRFVEETGIDSLAISIGTAHGLYKGEPKLRFDRLAEIASVISLPLVLHGGSGVPDEAIRKAISLGIAKINVDTELRQAFALKSQEIWRNDPEEYHLANVFGAAKEAMKEKVKEKIRLFESGGRG